MRNIKNAAITGARWTSIATAFITIVQFSQLAILSRLLSPKDFGLMALITMIMELALLFSEMGLSTAIIQRSNPKDTELSTLYWLNILTGFSTFFLVILFTPIFTQVFRSSEIRELLPAMSIVLFIVPFSSQFLSLLQKELKFRFIAIMESGISLLKFCITVSCAFFGLGVWSIIYGQLAGTVVQTAILAYYGWHGKYRPLFRFNWSDTKGYLSFGLFRVGAMAANHFNSRVDQLIIGMLLGPVQLGYYNIAFRLTLQPIQKINPIITRVAFPIFSAVQNDLPRLKRGYMKMIKMLMTINAPILIGLSATAHIIVPLLLGEQWIPAIGLVQILSLYSLVRSLGNAGGSLICARGHADWTFYWNVSLLFFIPAVLFAAGYNGSAVNIAMTLLGLQVLLFFAHYAYFIRKIIGPCFHQYILNIGRPVMIATLMGGSIFILQSLFSSLILLVISGGGIYIILSWFLNNESMKELIYLMPFFQQKVED